MRMTLRQRTVVAALAAALACLAVPAQEGPKVGVFDAELASRATLPGQDLHRKLNEQGEQFQAELDGLQTDLQRLQEEYSATSLSLSEEKRRDLEREMERKQIELQTKQQAFLRERQRDVASAQEDWSNTVRGAVEALGREEGYDLLLPAELVPFFSSAVDVTDRLIDRLGRAEISSPLGVESPATPPQPESPASPGAE